jgi:transposase-like protein
MLGQERKNQQHYPKQLKKEVAEIVVTGVKGLMEATRDYGIHKNTIIKWVKKYRSDILDKQTVEVERFTSMKKIESKEELEAKIKAQEEEIMQLRKKLHESTIRNEALNTLIDLADDTYGLSIRKNYGAKQRNK